MNSLLKKASAIIFLFFIFLATLAPKPVIASTFTEARLSNEQNLESFIAGKLTPGGPSGLMPIVAESLTSMAIGSRGEDGELLSDGAISKVFSLTGALYQYRPVSTGQYLAYVGEKINLSTPAYAQSEGVEFLEPTLSIWIVMRNLVYIFYIIIFVVVGFAIMFRSKLNPQTVVNISNALPNIVVSLILVTFSFAISGLIIDLVHILNGLITNAFYDKFVVAGRHSWQTDANPITLFKGADIGGNLSTALGGIGELLGGGGLALLFNLAIAFTMFSSVMKIFFNLLTKYISIFLVAIFSPLAILASAFPGASKATSGLFKQLISAALVFPATYFMINLASYFSLYAKESSISFKNLNPFKLADFVSVAGEPEITTATIAGLISLGIIMATVQIPQVIDKALNVGSGLGAGTGQEIGGALKKLPIIGGLIG